jgi:outer membrane biosynthesis protein TonB
VREAIDEVIALRAYDPAGLSRALTWSYALHAGLVVAFILFPRQWLTKTAAPEKVMVISLGGLTGPKESGPTTIGGRPVDSVVATPKRPEPVKAVATKPDTMVIPAKSTPPKKAPPKVEEKAQVVAPAPAPSRSTGPQVTPGNSRVETGVRGIGTGLQIGGGGMGGETTLSDFCCPAYLREVETRIRNKWDEHQTERGLVKVQFTIQRDGRVTDFAIAQHGTFLLDRASTVPFTGLLLPPLPSEFNESTLTLRLTFEYK